jgi:hypothetical protein
MRKSLLIGVASLCWAMWTSRNDIVFDNVAQKTYIQIIYKGTRWF